jgi:hypothetical protein
MQLRYFKLQPADRLSPSPQVESQRRHARITFVFDDCTLIEFGRVGAGFEFNVCCKRLQHDRLELGRWVIIVGD